MIQLIVINPIFQAGSNRWTKVSSNIKSTSCDVRNLEPGTKYEFRVAAENAQGVSEYLETATPVLAKLPYGEKFLYVDVRWDEIKTIASEFIIFQYFQYLEYCDIEQKCVKMKLLLCSKWKLIL